MKARESLQPPVEFSPGLPNVLPSEGLNPSYFQFPRLPPWPFPAQPLWDGVVTPILQVRAPRSLESQPGSCHP